MPANGDILDGEIVGEAADPALTDDGPRRGTLAWVRLQPVVDFKGEPVPACHRIAADALLAPPDGPDVTPGQGRRRCRVLRGDTRCKAPAAGDTGLCAGHAGVGGPNDPAAMRAKGVAKLMRLKATRELLGISASRAVEPRAAARIRAALRADELAAAIVDGPLDDPKLSSVERQRAMLSALDATYPLQTAELSVELSDPEGMDWPTMQRLAVSLLG